MTKGDPVDRDLAVLRAAIAPPSAAKQRVRRVLAGASAAPRPWAGRVRLPAVLRALGLVGAGALGGYWLGLGRARVDDAHPPMRVAHGATAAAASGPARTAAEARAGRENASADVVIADAGPRSRPAPDGAAAGGATGAPERSPGERKRPKRRANGSPPPATPRTSELLLLQRAERAIRAGEGALALSLVAELDERHPRPLFAEERLATRVLAQCSLRDEAAREQAEAFLETRPRSVYSDRVRKLCELERSSGPDVRGEPLGLDGSAKGEH